MRTIFKAVSIATLLTASSAGAHGPPSNWPKGHMIFNCVGRNGSSERMIQAFYDDIGGHTWDKYLIVAPTMKVLQAYFMTHKAAVLNPSDHSWYRTLTGPPSKTVTLRYVIRMSDDRRPLMKIYANGVLYSDCKAVRP